MAVSLLFAFEFSLFRYRIKGIRPNNNNKKIGCLKSDRNWPLFYVGKNFSHRLFCCSLKGVIGKREGGFFNYIFLRFALGAHFIHT